RYLLETGAANPSARTLDTPDEEIGEMMRMVIAHEVGHALGLPHNMAASNAYPVDSLRSGSFTKKYGIAATIMDYARYNYIAQPGDKDVRFIRQLGPYDHYSINWGYRLIPNATTPESEVKTLDKWISDKGEDPKYRFGSKRYDPSAQTEGIGDDQVKASTYGVKNLKIVAKNLQKWTSDQTNNYDDLSELYGELLSVWSRYSGHVTGVIGGVYEYNKKPTQKGYVYHNVSKTKQKASMKWLQKNVFATQKWLMSDEILKNTNHSGYTQRMLGLQNRQLYSILNASRLERMINAEVTQKDFYSPTEMVRDLRRGLFSETTATKNVDVFRRNLQKSFIERMRTLMNSKGAQNSDLQSIVRGELRILKSLLTTASNRAVNRISKYHYKDCVVRINTILNPKK
ncbi:MAG: zinc-dependent metalloprotease, partial [Flavobacteriaceae bacterium]|nr:zinc-dependent metalloprotease [Flavobacteriaceae bacterium]